MTRMRDNVRVMMSEAGHSYELETVLLMIDIIAMPLLCICIIYVHMYIYILSNSFGNWNSMHRYVLVMEAVNQNVMT